MFFVVSILLLSIGIAQPKGTSSFVPPDDLITGKFRKDSEAIDLASTDFGRIVRTNASAVFYPTSTNDIRSLIVLANNNNNSNISSIAARGQGHSVRGQSMAYNGVVVNMTNLILNQNQQRIIISESVSRRGRGGGGLGGDSYVDVGGEQIWIDVLNATLQRGLSPVSWTDYLYLSVGGTLSNAGISGQTFRFGPQVTNVYELDVITGLHSQFSLYFTISSSFNYFIFFIYVDDIHVHFLFDLIILIFRNLVNSDMILVLS